MGRADKRYRFPGEQIDCRKQGKCAEADILDRTGFLCTWNWLAVFHCIAGRLNARLFIIR